MVVSGNGKLLITGGGVFNTFLIENISHFTNAEIVIPSNELVNFKEALIFAFLGVLKLKGQINCNLEMRLLNHLIQICVIWEMIP